MIDLVYIQKKNKEFINETAFILYRGCNSLGIPVSSFESFEDLDIRKSTVVHGYTGIVLKALSKLNVSPSLIDSAPPKDLESFYGRKLWKTNMKSIREMIDCGNFCFIKPLNNIKTFTGHVTSCSLGTLSQIAHLDDDFEILASETVDFVSEYRLFIHNGLIRGCRHYCGDFTKFINFDVVFDILKCFKNQPKAFSLDMGVTSDNRTLIVEINDFFSLGAYGQSHISYAEMVIDRWKEIVQI